MTEYIIRDDVLYSIQQTCFEAGKRRHEIFTVRGPGEEVIRCRDCVSFELDNSDHEYRVPYWCNHFGTGRVKPDGFCSWAERRQA